MMNPLKTLLELLATRSTGQVATASITDLFSAESISSLKKAAILQDGEPNKTVPCASCDDEHQVEWKKLPDGRFLAFCERNGGPQFVSKDEVVTSQIETKAFLSALAAVFGMEPDIKPLVSDELWEIGVITVAKHKRKALFLRTNSSQRHIELINALSQAIPVTVFSIHAVALGATEQVMFIDPTLVASLVASGLRANTKELETATAGRGHHVALGQNGDLTLDGKVLCTIPPHSIDFSFAERLMQSYGNPVAHAELYSYCTKTHGTESGRTPQRFCNDYRSNIRKLSKQAGNEAIVEKIIIKTKTTTGENAYKIQNPIEKVTGK